MSHMIENAEILCVGTELMLGDIVNTNAAFLAQRLAELGIGVHRHTAVGDNPQRLKEALDAALSVSDLVITSGGLGPTYDDMTKETVASYFGYSMELHEASLTAIREYFAKTGRIMTKNNEKQAMMPKGATVFPNRFGTAPALAITGGKNQSKTVIMLPGPPGELQPLFYDQVLPYLQSRRDKVLVSRNLHIFGMGESMVEEKLGNLMTEAKNPTVAPYCKEGEVRLRITAQAADRQTAEKMCDGMIDTVCATEVGQFVYGVDIGSLEAAVVTFLHEKKLTLACAESLTGGLIAKRLTDLSGVSDVFWGGCVTYTNEAKQALLGVKAETLDRVGPVSAEVAMEMAEGVRRRLGVDIGVSATGLAGPGGGTEEKPVGTVYLGISTAKGTAFRRLSLSSHRSRDYIRQVSASNAYDMVLHCGL